VFIVEIGGSISKSESDIREIRATDRGELVAEDCEPGLHQAAVNSGVDSVSSGQQKASDDGATLLASMAHAASLLGTSST